MVDARLEYGAPDPAAAPPRVGRHTAQPPRVRRLGPLRHRVGRHERRTDDLSARVVGSGVIRATGRVRRERDLAGQQCVERSRGLVRPQYGMDQRARHLGVDRADGDHSRHGRYTMRTTIAR